MENKKQKCSSIEHQNINAINYCHECKIFMCNKCENFHSKLFQNHHFYDINKDIKEIFTGFCKEENHLDKLEFFCKNHNLLCCASCITKIKRKGKGQHTDCNICNIEDIKDEKKNKLRENIEKLENLSLNFEQSINQLKSIFENINKNKEELKLKIQKIFTKIRNVLNEREDQLLLEVDKKYDNLYIKEDILKENEKLPNKIKISLERSKALDNEWNDDNQLSKLINDSIDIENNIKNIDIINQSVININNENNTNIRFIPEEDDKVNLLLDTIKMFGQISNTNNNFKFKKCPINIQENRYDFVNENDNIIIKTGKTDKFIVAICEKELEKNKIHKWKIKIIKSKSNSINIGVSPIDIDINSLSPFSYGWFLYCKNSKLYSGKPQNYFGKETKFKIPKDEIILVMDMIKGILKFKIDGEDKGESYTNIPTDKPLVPVVTLYNADDSFQLIEC